MVETQTKEALLRNYLKQQISAQNDNMHQVSEDLLQEGKIHVHRNTALVPYEEDNTQELEEFKTQVKHWIKLDNEVKDINAKIRLLDNERKQRKKIIELLSAKILQFMSSNEIDELNSKDGVLRYKKNYVKETLSQKQLIEKLKLEFNEVSNINEKLTKIFKDRPKVEKMRLLRS